MTVIKVKGYGRQKGHTELYCGAEHVVDFLPKAKIEIALSTDRVERVIETVSQTAKTGKIGDGKLSVFNLEDAVHIRGGEIGTNAL